MQLTRKDVISISDFSKDELLFVLDIAKKFEEGFEKGKYKDLLRGKVLGTLFYEPSTRTRLSFESAMKRLGGTVIGFTTGKVSSESKGETVYDTAKMVESYTDIIAVRHHIEGAPRVMAEAVSIPVINAGDGANQHPTQTFLDLYTIMKSKGTLDGLKIGFVGDLRYGRTVHSLAHAMTHFKSEMFFIAPEILRMPEYIREELDEKGICYNETNDLMSVCSELDIIYVTRIQKERFGDPLEYEKVKDAFMLDRNLLSYVKKDMKIMHPLPRVNEIQKEIDDTDHALYFEQAKNGVFLRQALLALLLGKGKEI